MDMKVENNANTANNVRPDVESPPNTRPVPNEPSTISQARSLAAQPGIAEAIAAFVY